MTTNQFLKMQIKNLPYCEYYRGPSNQFSETIFIKNKNTNKLMIIDLTKAKKPFVTVELKTFNKENSKKDHSVTLIAATTTFKAEMIPYEAIA